MLEWWEWWRIEVEEVVLCRNGVRVEKELGQVVVDGRSLGFGQEIRRELVGVALDEDDLLVFDEKIDEVELCMNVS